MPLDVRPMNNEFAIYMNSPWFGRGASTFSNELGGFEFGRGRYKKTRYTYLLIAPNELEPTTVGLKSKPDIEGYDFLYLRAESVEGMIVELSDWFDVLCLSTVGNKTSRMLTHYRWDGEWDELQPIFQDVYSLDLDAAGTARKLKAACGKRLSRVPKTKSGRTIGRS